VLLPGFVAAAWVYDWLTFARRLDGQTRCGHCGSPLHELTQMRCPACGEAL
jgi:ribosomal protein L34E